MVKTSTVKKKALNFVELTHEHKISKPKRAARIKTVKVIEDLEARTIADIISNTRIGDPVPLAQ